jgi:uncharacterized protein YcbX
MTSPFYFPIVACAGLTMPDAAAYDKQWLVINADNHWLAQSHCEKLADVQVGVSLGYLVIRGEGMLRLDIPLDVIEDDDSVCMQAQVGQQSVMVVDEGDLAAAWFTRFLGQPCRLVKVHPNAGRVLWPEL